MVPSGSGWPREGKDLEGHRGDAQSCSWESGHALPLVPPSQERRAPQSHEAMCKGRMQGGPQVGPGPGVATQPPGGPGAYSPLPGGGQDQLQPSLLSAGSPVWPARLCPALRGARESPCLLHRNFPPGGASRPITDPTQPVVPRGSGPASRPRPGTYTSFPGSVRVAAPCLQSPLWLSLPSTHQSRHSPSPGREVGPRHSAQ